MMRELPIYHFKSTTQFDRWLTRLDRSTRLRVLARLARVECGNLGDYRFIDSQLMELRCFFGGGIRMYFVIQDKQIIWLLGGGDKSSQAEDILQAQEILRTGGYDA